MALVLWMVLIFLFSAKTAEESSRLSGSLTEVLARFFFRDWFFPENAGELHDHLEKFEYLLRKAAHFSEYFVLGGLLSLFLGEFDLKAVFRLIIGTFTGILYAMSDEFHQSFVSGRAMQGFDILIDSGGVILGVFIVSGISAMILLERLKEKKKAACG